MVIAAGAEVEAARSLGQGPLISRNRDTEGCGVWVASGESRVAGHLADQAFEDRVGLGATGLFEGVGVGSNDEAWLEGQAFGSRSRP